MDLYKSLENRYTYIVKFKAFIHITVRKEQNQQRHVVTMTYKYQASQQQKNRLRYTTPWY